MTKEQHTGIREEGLLRRDALHFAVTAENDASKVKHRAREFYDFLRGDTEKGTEDDG